MIEIERTSWLRFEVFLSFLPADVPNKRGEKWKKKKRFLDMLDIVASIELVGNFSKTLVRHTLGYRKIFAQIC